jgi:hypothetical protein
MSKILQRITFFVAIIIVATISLVGCTKAPEEQPLYKVDALSFLESNINVTSDGGEIIVDFSLDEGFGEATIKPYYSESWIENIEILTNKMLLTIAANDNRDERSAVIEFSYDGVLQQNTLTIVQDGNIAKEFTIAIESIEAKSCITLVTPANKQMEYVMYVSEASYFIDSGIVTAEQLIEDDLSYFCNAADFEGMSLRDYMIEYQVLFSDTQRTQWNGISPGILSIIYVYGVEFSEDGKSYTAITPVFFEKIIPATAPIDQTISFDIATEVESADAAFSITPNMWDGHYYIEVLDENNDLYINEGDSMPEGYTERVASDWMSTCNYYRNIYGMSYDKIIEDFCYSGNASGSWELLSDMKYMVMVYAVDIVDGVLQMVSNPSLHYLKTEKITPSGQQLDIKVENIYSHVCDLSITPTNDREPYVMLITPTDVVSAITNDNDLINYILNDLSPWSYKFRGAMSSHINTLYEQTEYVVFAFGYHGGIVTTELFKHYFTTLAAEKGTNAVTEVAFNGPYDPVELASYNPEKYGVYFSYAGLYLMWMETHTERETEDKFHMFVDTATYYYFGEDIIFSDLVAFICDPVTVNHGYFGEPYIVVGAAMDERGNYSDMWKSESFTWYESDKRPISELIAKIEGTEKSDAKLMSCVPSRVYNSK